MSFFYKGTLWKKIIIFSLNENMFTPSLQTLEQYLVAAQ